MGGPVPAPIVPLSDGAGEVIGVGAGVTRFKAGDRVAGTFFMNWNDGAPNPFAGPALGAAGAPGMLADVVVLPESAVVRIATSLSFAEAATLPCAGVTAWNALFEGPRPIKPGDRVLLLGTGGVSTIALLLAKAAGCEIVITSSDDAKIERAKALGADHGVNYKTHENWGRPCRAAFRRRRQGGRGRRRRHAAAELCSAAPCSGSGAHRRAQSGRRAQSPPGSWSPARSCAASSWAIAAWPRKLADAIDANGLKPVIGATFAMEAAKDRFAYVSSPALFGKAVITLD